MKHLVTLVAAFLVAACVAAPPPPAAPPPAPPALAAAPAPSPVEQTIKVPVLIATDRPKFDKTGVTDASYGVGVNTLNLQYGLATAELPLCHNPGLFKRLEHKLFGLKVDYSPTENDVWVFNIHPLVDKDQFVAELKSEIKQAKNNEIFVFVHGYNTTLHDGIKEAAWLKVDLSFAGPVVLYSWPSNGRALAFFSDVDLALASAQHLELFLKDLANSPNIKGIHVLAHSLGSRPLMYALYDLRNNSPVTGKLKNVILAAPEIPRVTYSQITAEFKKALSYRSTLYASNKDNALRAALDADAALSTKTIPRLGDGRQSFFVHPPLYTIDASAVDLDVLGHHYFANGIVTDMHSLIANGLPPDRRRLIPKSSPNGGYWAIPAGMPHEVDTGAHCE